MRLNPIVVDDEEGPVPRWWVHRIDEDKRHPWRHRRLYLNDRFSHSLATRDRVVEGRIEWSLFRKNGFGWGFKVGRNGDESHIGLDLYAGRLGSVWMRLRSPWTKWANIEKKGDDDREWYKPRHYGVRLFPHDGCYFRAEWDAREGESSRNQPWWREVSLTKYKIWGRTASEKIVEDSGACVIPMPEGTYPATWEKTRYEQRHVRWPGTRLDRVKRNDQPATFSIDEIPGGIPSCGKGENSYDCGMDGLFGISGGFRTLEAAIGGAVESALRDRTRRGGPHNLPHPMSVSEAEEWVMANR